MKIFKSLIPILLLLFFENVYSQNCPYTHPIYIDGFGCTSSTQIKSSFCSPKSNENSLSSSVRLFGCESGETEVKTRMIDFSTQYYLYYCMTPNLPLILYSMIGGCVDGDTVSSVSATPVTVSSTLRYIHSVVCINMALSNIYIESSSSTQYSQALTNQCGGLSPSKYTLNDILTAFTCPIGYSGFPCSDINECFDPDICRSPSKCENLVPGYRCNCPSGYTVSQDGSGCDNINECSQSNICKSPAQCIDLTPGYECKCPTGYSPTQDNGCQDIDECSSTQTNGCLSPAQCNNLSPGYECKCPNGYKLSDSKLGCDDINECTSSTHDCQDQATCINSNGGFSCVCNVQGYELDSTKKKCIDINECLKTNKCVGLSSCLNKNGSYECKCQQDYHLILNGTDCAQDSDILLSTFQQKPNSFYRFTLSGKRFPSSPTIKIGDSECNLVNGNDSFIECSTSKGIQVIGEVFVQDFDKKASNIIQFEGAPFISGYSPTPLTQGGSITLSGSNLPTSGSISLKINSIECPIVSLNSNQIVCSISEGSGANNQVELKNELVSNTDATLIKYSNPIIESTSSVYSSGGILTIYGSNFGTSNSKVTVNIGKSNCKDVVVKSHHELTCVLDATKDTYTQIIDLQVDGLPCNDYYFTFSNLEAGQCESNCNGNGKCTVTGCSCYSGFSGIACNETSGEIGIHPPLIDKPIVDINDSKLEDYGYRVSVVAIEELDILDSVETSVNLLELKWSLNSTVANKWIYNIVLPNQALLECTYEYFKSATNITFADTQFQVPDESLKLSFKTQNWPFTSKLNSLRVLVETNTTLLLETSKQCSINESPTNYYYNQHLWVQTENSQSGITARFVKYASIDNKQIVANVKPLQSSKFTSLVSVSLPYFKDTAIIDPDFSTLLNVGNKKVGNCNSSSSSSSKWRIATGASIGAVVGVALVASSVYLLNDKKAKTLLLNKLNPNKSNK